MKRKEDDMENYVWAQVRPMGFNRNTGAITWGQQLVWVRRRSV